MMTVGAIFLVAVLMVMLSQTVVYLKGRKENRKRGEKSPGLNP